jgi:hypothetical protein
LTALLVAASKRSPAICPVIFARSANWLVREGCGIDSYQIVPAVSYAGLPNACATNTKARFGIPELMCTPPESAGPT